ncbi:MAG: flagellar protein FlgN [Pseudomonadales bacterium]
MAPGATATHDHLLERCTALLDVLLAERAALIGTSADDLQVLVSRKESLCADIAGIQHTLLDALKPATTLPDSMSELRSLVQRCRDENTLNGRIANRARRSTRTLLAILTGEDSDDLYDRGGSSHGSAPGTGLAGHRLGSA